MEYTPLFMKYVHLFTGADGKSHFEDVEIFSDEKEGRRQEAEKIKATGVIFRASGKDYDLGWHPAPVRQFVVTLEGAVDVIAGDGAIRRFGPGDILLVDDKESQGHKTRAVNHQNRKAIYITLE